MKSYDSLSTFPDVEPAFTALSADPDIEAYIFSNGTESMLIASVNGSPSLSPFSSVFKGLITADDAGIFKSSPVIYQHLISKVAEIREDSNVASLRFLVSANPFDIVGARLSKSGCIRTVWVDRTGAGWNDKLGQLEGLWGGSDLVANGVGEAVKAIKNWWETVQPPKH